jgi:serine/threonine-protein kinase
MTVATSPSQSSIGLPEQPVAFPRYQLVSRLATGGMAEVFLAIMPSDLGPAKPVVIKRLWPELARDPECIEMFLGEVRLSLRLHHPNVIHAYESGHDGDRHFLVMEYLDGQSLKHILDRFSGRPNQTAISLPLALKIVSDVLMALDHVHNLTDLEGRPLQIVHRDVSPQNVFVTCDGTVKLIDFGIAQSTQAANAKPPREAKGRVAYMAPEQAAGAIVDHRADLFSVGVMLWEMAVGRRLWQGQTDAQIRERLLAGQPIPYLPKSHGFPPGLAAICSRALAVDPRERYQSAPEFQSELDDLITGSMPVQSRLLGEMVAREFASSRALSRSMLQQSLPGSRAARTSSSCDLPKLVVSNPAAHDFPALWARSHSSTYTVAATHNDITQVSPEPKMNLRPRLLPRWLLGAVGVAVFTLAGVLVARSLPGSRAPEPAVAKPLQAEQLSIPALPIKGTAGEAEALALALAPLPTTRPLSNTAKGAPSLRKALHPRPWPATGSTSVARPPAPYERDYFEVAKVKTAKPRAHAIDSEDPYAR